MATTYTEMIALVRDWSNRDVEALPDNIIRDSLRWAADKAYRTLRVPPLEKTVYYSLEDLQRATGPTNNRQASTSALGIPADLIEFIHIRGVDSELRTTRMFNEKADIRTFWDLYAEKYSDLAIWARQGDQIFLSPGVGIIQNFGSRGIGSEAGIELYYYSRLPALNAAYEVNAANFNVLQFSEVSAQGYPEDGSNNAFMRHVGNTPDAINMLTEDERARSGSVFLRRYILTPASPIEPGESEQGNIRRNNLIVAFDTREEAEAAADIIGYTLDTAVVETTCVGLDTPHWLRDENERVLLMGALAECFFYLQENDEAQKYIALFQQEIAELNNEDVMRNASGGNVQVNFNGRGLI